MSEEIWKSFFGRPKLPADYFATPEPRHWRTAARDHSALLVNIIQMFHMVYSKCSVLCAFTHSG